MNMYRLALYAYRNNLYIVFVDEGGTLSKILIKADVEFSYIDNDYIENSLTFCIDYILANSSRLKGIEIPISNDLLWYRYTKLNINSIKIELGSYFPSTMSLYSSCIKKYKYNLLAEKKPLKL